MYTTLACHLLPKLHIVIENSSLHRDNCPKNEYQSFDGRLVNKCCSNLKYSPKLKKLIVACKYIQRKIWRYLHVTIFCRMINYVKSKNMQVEKLKLRLDLLNSVFKISRLRRSLSMHQRFLVNLSDHNVPHLQQLVQVALKNNRSIGYILSNVMGGVDGIHMPNPTQSDKDLAFLVLKFGGPSLLNILYRAHVLPHESTSYRMAKMCPPIVSSVQDTVAKCFESNTKISETGRCAVVEDGRNILPLFYPMIKEAIRHAVHVISMAVIQSCL